MNKYIWLLMVGLCLTGAAHASIDPTWAGDDGSVHASWDQWVTSSSDSSGLNTVYSDEYTVLDYDGNELTEVSGQDDPDAQYTDSSRFEDSEGACLGLDSDWDLSFWMPSFSGYEVQEGWMQFTYWDDENDADWRASFDPSITLYSNSGDIIGSLVYEGEEEDGSGLITEAYSFVIDGSADGFFVSVATEDGIESGAIWLDSMTIDTISYDVIPEPATGAMFLFGMVCLQRIRSKKSK